MKPFLFLAQSTPADRLFGAAGGLFVVALTCAALLLAVLWIIFPFVVWRQLGELIAESKRQSQLLASIAKHTAPPAKQEEESAVRYNPLKEDTSSIWWALLVLVAVGLIVAAVMANR